MTASMAREHRPGPCSSSSTSATPRPTSAPSAGSELVEHWRFATVRTSTADELGAALRNLLALRGLTLRGPRRLDRLLDRAAAPAGVDRDGGALPRARRCRSSGRACGPGCRSGSTTRASSAPTGSSTPSPPTSGSAAPCVVVDFGTALTYDVVSGRRRVPRRHHRAGRRDLDGGAHRARRGDPADRPGPAAGADRQVDGRGDPLGRRSTASPRRSTGSSGGCARSWARRPRRSPPAGSPGAIVPFCELIDEIDDLLTLTGLR